MQTVGEINGFKLVDPEKYKYHVFIACFFAFMLDNVDMMTTSIGLPLLLDAFQIDTVQGGMIGTAMLIGAAIGAWFWGPLADRLGRRKAYLICLTWYTVFTFSCAFCNTLMPFVFLRFMCGLALGGAWTIGVSYLSDFFPEAQRARAVALVQMSSVIGMLFVTALVRWAVPSLSWRILFWAALAAIPLIIYFFWLPESPVWIQNKFGEGAKAAAEAKAQEVGLGTVFSIPQFRRAVILASLLILFIQMAYWGANNWIPTYLTTERGLSVEAMTSVVMAMYFGAIPGYIVAGWACDKFGRRITYIIGTIIAAVAVLAYMNFATDTTVLIYAAVFGFASCGLYGPLGAFVSEMVPQQARGRVVGFVWGIGRIASAAMPIGFGALATVTGLGFCISLCALFYAGACIVSLLLKETRGHSMENVSVVDGQIVTE